MVARHTRHAADFPLPLDTAPMEAKSAEQLPKQAGAWQYEPKWDGFRCLAFKAGNAVDLRAKSGKPLGGIVTLTLGRPREGQGLLFHVN